MRQGSIYFVVTDPTSDAVAAMKIGFTSGNPMVRVAALQTGCPSQLELIGYLPGTMHDERRMHWRCAENHIRGEWYRIDGVAFQEMIAAADHLHHNPV